MSSAQRREAVSKGPQRRLRGALLGLVLVAVPAVAADEIGDALDASLAAQRAARESQARIDRLDDEARALRDKARAVEWQGLQLSAYAAQLEDEAAIQERRRGELEAELKRVAATGTDLQPLMQRMVDELDAFVVNDLPFLRQQRQQRVAELRALIADPQRRSADKFRRVLEAYRTEVDYGYSLGVEDVELDCGGGRAAAALIHFGRVALYCVRGDGRHAAFWDAAAGRWVAVDEDDIEELQRTIEVARGGAPQLLVLPMRPAGRAQ